MPHVEHREAPFAIKAEAVLREQRVAVQRADAAAAVGGLGEGANRGVATRLLYHAPFCRKLRKKGCPRRALSILIDRLQTRKEGGL